jgi:hypothetical protein
MSATLCVAHAYLRFDLSPKLDFMLPKWLRKQDPIPWHTVLSWNCTPPYIFAKSEKDHFLLKKCHTKNIFVVKMTSRVELKSDSRVLRSSRTGLLLWRVHTCHLSHHRTLLPTRVQRFPLRCSAVVISGKVAGGNGSCPLAALGSAGCFRGVAAPLCSQFLRPEPRSSKISRLVGSRTPTHTHTHIRQVPNPSARTRAHVTRRGSLPPWCSAVCIAAM